MAPNERALKGRFLSTWWEITLERQTREQAREQALEINGIS